ncbi:MAG TPA: hypothetical protein VHU41_00255, partial [Thermoanaerobaculia bacterium]|nr:hypothetical protein [Thermoanaerobaculia bacterium]
IEESIDLKKDMSGTANLKLGVDMEPMITIMAMMQKQMEGKKGPLTKEELAAAKADFKKSAKKTSSTEAPADPKKDMDKSLPPGVKLLDASVTEKEFGMVTNMKFAFDKLAHLVDVKMPSKADAKGGPPDPTKSNVLDSPFQGLDVVETASTITIRTKPQNPADKVKSETSSQGPPMDPETQKMMEDAFKNMRFAWKITAPFEVISSNAHRREGNTLIWEYDFKKLQALGDNPKAMDDLAVKVVYKK